MTRFHLVEPQLILGVRRLELLRTGDQDCRGVIDGALPMDNRPNFFIDGGSIQPAEDWRIPVTNPTAEDPLYEIAVSSHVDLDPANLAARQAFDDFSATVGGRGCSHGNESRPSTSRDSKISLTPYSPNGGADHSGDVSSAFTMRSIALSLDAQVGRAVAILSEATSNRAMVADGAYEIHDFTETKSIVGARPTSNVLSALVASINQGD